MINCLSYLSSSCFSLFFSFRPIIKAGCQEQAAAVCLQGTEGECGVWGQRSEGTSLASTSPTTICLCTDVLRPLNDTLPGRSVAVRGLWPSPQPIILLQIWWRPPPTCPLSPLQCRLRPHLLLQPSFKFQINAQPLFHQLLITPQFHLCPPGSQRGCPPL